MLTQPDTGGEQGEFYFLHRGRGKKGEWFLKGKEEGVGRQEMGNAWRGQRACVV